MSTPQTPPSEAPTSPPAPMVRPEPESRLDQLSARFETAQAKAKAAEKTIKEFEELKTAIKTELAKAHPGAPEVLLSSPHLGTPLKMTAVETWRVDSKAMKAKDPLTYATWATKGLSWRLGAM